MYLKVEMFPPAVEVRAVLEGQFLARRMYAEQGGLLGKLKNEVLALCHKDHPINNDIFSLTW